MWPYQGVKLLTKLLPRDGSDPPMAVPRIGRLIFISGIASVFCMYSKSSALGREAPSSLYVVNKDMLFGGLTSSPQSTTFSARGFPENEWHETIDDAEYADRDSSSLYNLLSDSASGLSLEIGIMEI